MVMALIQNPAFFFLILPAFLLLYHVIGRFTSLQNLFLLFVSLLFYSWGNLTNGLLLIFLITIDFLAVKSWNSTGQKKKFILYLAVAGNICIWSAYKFFTPSLPEVFTAVYPVGISYFMLKKLAFLLNQFRRKENRTWTLVEYGVFVSFFPQILSGPVQLPESFFKQINDKKPLPIETILLSAKLFVLGFLKKVAIADNMGLLVNRVFQLENPSLLMAFTGALGFSVQLFADFSAYTDISRGVSILLGFDPPKNFNAPFLAVSPQDFWNRWHITLSAWLRTYIFNPVRRKLIRAMPDARGLQVALPALITMLASGLWHGNTPKFLIWGLYQGLILIGFRALENVFGKIAPNRAFLFLKWLLTFVLMMAGWLLFRGSSVQWVIDIFINSRPGFSGDEFVTAVSILSMVFMYSLPLILYRLIDGAGKAKRTLEPLYFALAAVILLVFSASGVQDFLYFEF